MTLATASVAVSPIPSSSALECPECCAELVLTQAPVAHEILPCEDCGVELEVISVEPLTIDLAPEVEEDWGE